jgi:nucleoside diphosphate kinase
MIKMETAELLEAVEAARSNGRPVVLDAYRKAEAGNANEFLLFLKPSIVATMRHRTEAVDAVGNALQRFQVDLTSACVVPGDYLRAKRTIREHYGIIDQVSRRGLEAVPASQRTIPREWAESYGVTRALGAHQYLEENPAISPEELTRIFDGRPTHRFASGAYGVVAESSTGKVVLLNGFHPEQVSLYEEAGSAIVILTATSRQSWMSLRREMIGATDPRKAAPGSLRSDLLANQDAWGIAPVSSLRNGIHMSAGPVEAMVEIGRFLLGSDKPDEKLTETTFGESLSAVVGVESVVRLGENASVLKGGHRASAFDATEEQDAATVLEWLERGEIVLDMEPCCGTQGHGRRG